MDENLTALVLNYQKRQITLKTARDAVLSAAYQFLQRRHGRDEDEVSEFLLDFYDKIPNLMERFQDQGLPFRHFLLRSLTWQWKTFQTTRIQQARHEEALSRWATDEYKGDLVSEPAEVPVWTTEKDISHEIGKSLVLLILKTWSELSPSQVEILAAKAGLDLAWVQASAARLEAVVAKRKARLHSVLQRLSEAHLKRVVVEQDCQTEADPCRRAELERKADWYRKRIRSLLAQRASIRVAPTHQELAHLLGIPKGTIDSRVYHLKHALVSEYSTEHDGPHSGD